MFPMSQFRKIPAAVSGFTLIELCVSTAIIGLLVTLLVVATTRIQASATASGCLHVLRQYGAAFNLYAADNNDTFPSGASSEKWYSTLAPYMGATNAIKQARGGTCPELARRFNQYADYFTGGVRREDRRGYQYNRYLNPGTEGSEPIRRAALADRLSRTLLLWEGVGVGSDSRHISGYPGGSYTYPKYRHHGTMNLLMTSGEVVSRKGVYNPDERVADAALPVEEGGINWKKSGDPFYFK
jgi:prepilin-type N-terminal cleavage/methylation domain-containing protein